MQIGNTDLIDLQYKAKFKITFVPFLKELIFSVLLNLDIWGMEIKTCLSLLLSVIIFLNCT